MNEQFISVPQVEFYVSLVVLGLAVAAQLYLWIGASKTLQENMRHIEKRLDRVEEGQASFKDAMVAAMRDVGLAEGKLGAQITILTRDIDNLSKQLDLVQSTVSRGGDGS